MELLRTGIASGAGVPSGRARLFGEVIYDRGQPRRERLWFEYPEACADHLSCSGNPWLACLLPLAVSLGEELRIALPVSPRLLSGCREVMAVWRSWYPNAHEVPIHAEVSSEPPPVDDHEAAREGVFYSGGVDSTFTALRATRHPEGAEPRSAAVDLITVLGLDVPLGEADAGQRLIERHRRLAQVLGTKLVDVRTNVRDTRWRAADWERLSHGAVLAAIGLGLEPRYRTIRIAATGGYRDLHPWGSHPVADPLFSTQGMEVVHDGAAFRRVDKLKRIVGHGAALDALRVCWSSRSDRNCGECGKCYRTMLILHLLGALERAPTFPSHGFDLGRTSRVYCRRPWDFREFRDLRSLALELERPEVAAAATRAMEDSRRLSARLERVNALGTTRLGSRVAAPLRKRLLRGWIT